MAAKKRKLGKSGLEVSPLCFGGNVFGWTVDEQNSFKILDAFVDAGFNFVDTADAYSSWVPGNKGGESETIIGKWFKQSGKRDKVVLASKVGNPMGPDKKGLSKAYILSAVEDSLKRLQTDYIDLYQSHLDDVSVPLEETLETYSQLVKQGKIRLIGASNTSGKRLAEALQVSEQHGYPSYVSIQPLYNLYDRAEFETTIEPTCLEKGVGVIPWYSLACGFLTGKYRSEADLTKSPRGKTVKRYLTERGFGILAALDQVAKQHGSTPARVALAWLMARPSITAPISSASNLDQLKDIMASTALELDSSTIELLNRASA